MHDIRAIRDDPATFDAGLSRRRLPPVAAELVALDAARRDALTQLGEKQARRNAASKEIGQGRRQSLDTSALEAEVAALKRDMESIETNAAAAEAALRDRLAALPNTLDPEIPDGADETANIVLHRHGTPPTFDFAPRQHFELGEALGLMSFEDAAKISGSRFVVLRGALARLERALGQFMLDLHTTEHGYTETAVPLLVNEAAMFGTNQLPKFADEAFVTTDGRWLIPTAEVALTNLAAGQIIAGSDLPIRTTALTACFRSEAGSAGRDTRGMLRQHQFTKCELVSITHPDASDAEHERMTRAAETVLERLELPYRRMLLCAGDTGFGAARTHDLEVWLPGQNTWREISSCSNTRAFQARRMNARYRPANGPVGFVHTLNGSGVAVGRALIAVLENHQRPDGSIAIPSALRPYMAGLEHVAS
jgi:seryl-tRNA synthetase